MKHLYEDPAFIVNKSVADQLLSNVRESERYLAWVTYMHLIACFVAFTGLYYPNFKIPGTNVGSHDINLFFPFTMNILLSSVFALHGYYMWRFYETRIYLHDWVTKHFKPNKSNVDLTGFVDSYRGTGAYETIFHNSNKKVHISAIILSTIFAISHVAIILNLIQLFRIDQYVFLTSLVISASLIFVCYINYQLLVEHEYNNSIGKTKPRKTVEKLIIIILYRNCIKREKQWKELLRIIAFSPLVIIALVLSVPQFLGLNIWGHIRYYGGKRRVHTAIENEDLLIRITINLTLMITIALSCILISDNYSPHFLSGKKYSYGVRHIYEKSWVGNVRVATIFVATIVSECNTLKTKNPTYHGKSGSIK